MSRTKNSSKSSATKPNNKRSTKKSITTSICPLMRNIDRSSIPSDTWVVFRANKAERKALMFAETSSRDQVRSAYARETGTPYQDVRSRRFRNYYRRSSND